MGDYKITWDWAVPFRSTAERILPRFKDKPITYLEIGVYEANSLCWMLDNILTHPDSRAIGVEYNMQPNGWHNIERHKDKVQIFEGDSKIIVPGLNQKFDIIYIDGDHSAKGALFDTVHCWNKAKGIVIWDDYRKFCSDNHVWAAIKGFFSCIPAREYKVLVDNYQFAVERLLNN